MSIVGLALKLSYLMSRYRLGFLPLSYLPAALALASVVAARAGLLGVGHALLAVALCIILTSILLLARRQGYIVFRQREEGATPDFTPLVPDEKVLLRATGHFEVSGMRRYFVEIIAAFSTLETREHVVMGWIPPSRFLLLASWPKAEVGMWYIFFKPEAIREIAVGEVHFGLRARPAIRINYRRDKGGEGTLYLSFDDPLQRQRVLEDLRRDAPYLA